MKSATIAAMKVVQEIPAKSIEEYHEFLRNKVVFDRGCGFECNRDEVNPILLPHQKDMVCWAVRGGRRAIFSAFGLGKTMIQLEVLRLSILKAGAELGLVVLPLGVRTEFFKGAEMLGIPVTFIRSNSEIKGPGIYLTNYESVREGKLDPTRFDAISLDEASCLRGFGGTKTFREFMRLFEGSDTLRFVATATPSPNEFEELLAYSAFLEVMDVGQAKTRFFKRDAERADHLTLHEHKEEEFWLWVSSWAIFIQKPSDLGYSDEGYELPPLDIRWHRIPTDHSEAGQGINGQHKLIKDAALSVIDSSREKRSSLDARVAKMLEIRQEDPTAHRILWHDLEDERRAIEKAIPDVVSVYGSQDLDAREKSIIGFSNGEIRELAAKPRMLGSGCNFQRHCAWAIFVGIGFKFNDFIQAVHRIQRFLQTKVVRIDLIYTEAEDKVREDLERKWRQHEELMAKMTEIIKRYGLGNAGQSSKMERSIGVERKEASGNSWKLVNNDCIEETYTMESDSVDLVVTSIPFSTQYEYTPTYNDFGHTDDNSHFWEQMDFLTPQLMRIVKPGRVVAVHVKDRIVPGGLTGLGFQTVQPFSDECIAHFVKHGFGFLARKTVVTDVVRENKQTNRLGWTEQCKDGSRMGAGLPEYVLIFRKPQTDRTRGYADEPVVKSKDEYTRGRWQFDAHGFMRSNGDRPITPEDLIHAKPDDIFKMFRHHSLTRVYNFDHDVRLADALDSAKKLPPSFMLLQPQSWHPDVWTDIFRAGTLNNLQSQKGKEKHLCPLQFDIVNRLITQFSEKGEVVFDPFSGLGTVAREAVKLERIGWGCELSDRYWMDSIGYVKAMEEQMSMPTLFDFLDADSSEGVK